MNLSQDSQELIAIARESKDEDSYWNVIGELHKRGTSLEFEIAKKLSTSSLLKERQIAADILGQLGYSKRSFHDESVTILISLLNDSDSVVLSSSAFALGHRNDERGIEHLIKHINHPEPEVRHGVAFGLSGLEDDRAIKALITLSEDDYFDARNWATFGLGTQIETDTEEIRDALFARIKDQDPEIRGEALIGLANRKDPRLKNFLLKELSGDFEGTWAVEAAEITEDSDYLSILYEIKECLLEPGSEYYLNSVNEAINACRKGNEDSND